MHPRIHSFLRTLDGKLAAAIVREFLEFYDLHHTASVFEPEAGAVSVLNVVSSSSPCSQFT